VEDNMRVSILMGSDSDFNVMVEAAKILKNFSIDFEIRVISAHRTPEKLHEYVKQAESSGIEVFIAGAGGAAHLAGVIASLTNLPVIAVPIETKLGGLDSLLSMVQMPSGIPVATVSINGAKNAGILATQILSIKYSELKEKLKAYRENMKEEVNKKDEDIQKKIFF
jgi:5-(carboxyamino)imidazole ribonucleotide mutase